MSNHPEIRKLQAHVPLDDLLGPLGYKNREDIAPAILQQIEEEHERCSGILEPQFIADMLSPLPAAASDLASDEYLAQHLDGALALGAGICTVGPAIDAYIEDCFGRGDFLCGMIADVVASRAVEEVGECCSDFLCAAAAEQKLSALCRISPGYGKWDVSGQRVLFSLLDPSPIGVSLNEYCMMQPKKSASFLIPLGEGEPAQKLQHSCHECTFRNCAYRRRSG